MVRASLLRLASFCVFKTADPSPHFPSPWPARQANSHCASDGRSKSSPVRVRSLSSHEPEYGGAGHSRASAAAVLLFDAMRILLNETLSTGRISHSAVKYDGLLPGRM